MKNLLHILLFLSFNFNIFNTLNEDLQDVYQEKLYIREDDLYQIDVSRFISLNNKPIVFSSNNENIQLPGILNKNSQLYLKSEKFNILDFKYDNEYIFILEKDQVSFIQLKYEEGDFMIQENVISEYINQQDQFKCSDMLRLDKILMMLCYHGNMKFNNEQQQYKILFYDYLDNELIKVLEFESAKFENPKFKFLQNLENFQLENEGKINLLVFSNKTQKQMTLDEQFFILEFDYQKKEESIEIFDFIKEKVFSINNLLFAGTQTQSRILNLIISNQEGNNLIIYIQEQTKKGLQKFVYTCQFENQKDINHIRFVQCEYKIKKQVSSFFLKQDNFMYQNMQDEIHFCSKTTSNCQMGKILPGWKIEQIIIEQNIGIVIMKIQDEYIIFVNDYQTQMVTWSKEKLVDVNNIFYYGYYKNDQLEKNLVIIQQKGFFKKDISFNNYVQISQPDLKNLEPIEVYQGDNMILKLDIEPYEKNSVINQYHKHIYPTIGSQSNEFQCKTGWIGENLNYIPQSNQKIKFFNNIKLNLIDKPDESNIEQYIFNNHKLFLLNKKSIQNYDCQIQDDDQKINCNFISKNEINLNEDQLKSIEQVGDIIFFNVIQNNSIQYINIKNQEEQGELKFEQNQTPNNCYFSLQILICVYDDSQKSIQILKFFSYLDLQLKELTSLNSTFKKYQKSFSKQMVKNDLTELQIKNVLLDQSDKRKVIIQYNALYGVNNENNFVSFYLDNDNIYNWVIRTDLQDNPDIKVDSMLFYKSADITILSKSPKFKLFGYDLDSLYVMSYLSVKNLLNVKYYPKQDLLGIIYESLQDQKYYFALIKLTKKAEKQIIKIEQIDTQNEQIQMSIQEYDKDLVLIIIYDQNQIIQQFSYYNKGPVLITQDIEFGININSKQYQIQYHEDSLFDMSGYRIIKDPIIEIQNWKQEQIFNIKDYYEFDGNLKTLKLPENYTNKAIQIQYPLTEINNFQKIGQSEEYFYSIYQDQIITKKQGHISIQSLQNQRIEEFTNLFPEKCSYENLDDHYYYCTQQKGITQILYVHKLRENNIQKYELMMPGSKFFIAISNQHNVFFFSQSVDNDKIIAYKKFQNSNNIEYQVIDKDFLQVPELNIQSCDLFLDKQTTLITLFIFDAENNNLIINHFDQKYQIQKTLKNYINLNGIEPLFKQVKCQQPKSTIFDFECVLISDIKIYYIEITKSIKYDVSDFVWEMKVTQEFYNTIEYSQLKQTDLYIEWNQNNLFLGANFQNYSKIIQYNFGKQLDEQFDMKLENQFIKQIRLVQDDGQDYLQTITIQQDKLNVQTFIIKDYSIIVNQPIQFRHEGIKFTAIFENGNEYDLLMHFMGEQVHSKITKKRIKSLRIFLIVGIALVSLLILISISLLAWLLWDRKKKNNEFIANETFDGPSFRITRLSVNNQQFKQYLYFNQSNFLLI